MSLRYPKIAIEVADLHPGIQLVQRSVQADTRACAACREEIGSGQIYETREGESLLTRVMHSRCAVCRDCRKDLRDQMYESEGKLLCAKDFFEREGYSCSLCEEPLTAYIDTGGIKVCEQCFQCATCKQGFPDGKGFYKHAGKFYCEKDLAKAQGNVCYACGEGVVGGQGLRALDELYHTSCWCCAGCGKELGRSFVEQDGRGYHQDCVHLEPIITTKQVRRAANPDENAWELASVSCKSCGGDVPGGEGRTINGDRYHPHCLTCASCRRELSGQFLQADGKFYCSSCGTPKTSSSSQESCDSCGKALSGSIAVYGNPEKKVHSDCLGCFKCNAKFPDGRFYLNEGRPACEDHA